MASEGLSSTVLDSIPVAPESADPVPDGLADGPEPAVERDRPAPVAQTDVRPKAAAETDIRPRAAAQTDVRPKAAAETDIRPAVPADAAEDRELVKTGGLPDPSAEPDRLTDPGPAWEVASPPERPPARRGPVVAWLQRHRLPVFALACAILAAAITIPLVSHSPSASSGRSGSSGPVATNPGFVALGNLSESPSPVDVYLYSSGAPSPRFVQHDVAYGTILPYRAVSAGAYSVKMRTAGSPASSNPVWSVSLTVKAGGTYTVVPLRTTTQQGQLKVIDNNLTVPRGKSFVRVIQADINEQKVTFHCSCAAGAPGNISTDAAPGNVSPQVAIPAGTWTMSATSSSAKTTSLPVTLTAGTVHTEIVVAAPGGGIQIINLTDAAGAHQAPTGGSSGNSRSYRHVSITLPSAWHFVAIASLAFSPSGTTLAIASEKICLWEIAAARCTGFFGSASITGVAFSPDGKTLAASDNSGHTYLWDIATGSQGATVTDAGRDGAFSVAFSPDGKTLATGDANGHTYLWNAATGKPILSVADPGSMGVNSVAFSPQGNILATGDANGHTYLWNAATGKPDVTLGDSGSKGVMSVAFSPDGITMAAGDNNGDTYIWNVASGKTITTLVGPSNAEINSVVFSADGNTLATGDQDGNAFLWYKN
jgi:hypothetical protein